MKHSERSNVPQSLRFRARASRTRSSVPSAAQRRNRQWQAWYGGVPPRQVGPLDTLPQDPHDNVERLTAAALGPSACVSTPQQPADERLKYRPLLIRQVHRCILLEDAAYHPFMR